MSELPISWTREGKKAFVQSCGSEASMPTYQWLHSIVIVKFKLAAKTLSNCPGSNLLVTMLWIHLFLSNLFLLAEKNKNKIIYTQEKNEIIFSLIFQNLGFSRLSMRETQSFDKIWLWTMSPNPWSQGRCITCWSPPEFCFDLWWPPRF